MLEHARARLRDLEALFAELQAHGALTVSSPPQAELREGASLDLVTVIQIDGDVTMFVARHVLASPAVVAEHLYRVEVRLGPLRALGEWVEAVERWLPPLASALVALPAIVKRAVHPGSWHDAIPVVLALLAWLSARFVPPVRRFLQRLATRLVYAGLRRWAAGRSMLPARDALSVDKFAGARGA